MRVAVRGGMAVLAPWLMLSAAHAQTSVVPAGAGTAVSPYQISQLGHLVWMGDNVGSSSGQYYTVQNDMDASDTTNWNSGAGFVPIGTLGTRFMGIFNGNGKVISNLSINRSSEDYVGLFGCVGSSGVVENLGLAGDSVTGRQWVGGLAGLSFGTVSGCYATGAVTATGTEAVGGLVGYNQNGLVSGCYATGPVMGANYYGGGLVGVNHSGTVSNCYATGSVTANIFVGGLVGYIYNGGTVSGCYASGSVTGNSFVGGLVGGNLGGSTVINSYWDTNTTGQATSDGGTAKTTAEMKQQTTFAGWDFTNVWGIVENVTYPFLVAIQPRAATPTFSPDGGSFTNATNVTVSCGTTGATIRYTTTGVAPTTNDSIVTNGGSVVVSQSLTLKAKAWAPGYQASDVKTSAFVISGAGGLWSGASDAGGGWKFLAWFGYFKDGGGTWGGWIWHAEHGWLYGVGTSPASIWLWSSRLGWLWTSSTVYPFLWSDSPQAWLWYYRGTGNGSGGWFYNYGTGQAEWH